MIVKSVMICAFFDFQMKITYNFNRKLLRFLRNSSCGYELQNKGEGYRCGLLSFLNLLLEMRVVNEDLATDCSTD